jgi:opacity protein-like surface antigen
MASAAVVSLTAAMSSAEAAQPYASLFGGANFLQSQTMSGHDHTRTTASYYTAISDQSLETAFKTGFVLGGNAGIEWGDGLRTELELAFRQNNSGKHAHLRTHYHAQFFTYARTDDGGYAYTEGGSKITTLGTIDKINEGDVPSNIRMRAWSLMANAWYDFDLGLPITPYVGGGIGLAQVKISGDLGRFTSSGVALQRLFEKNDSVFAWQIGAGASMPIADHVKAFVDYRYFAADGAQLQLEPGFNGGRIKADFNSHSLMVGLRFDL